MDTNSNMETPLTDAEIKAVRQLIREHMRFGPPPQSPFNIAESNRTILDAMKKRRKGLTIDGNLVEGLTADAD
jgi:hypothetical protein